MPAGAGASPAMSPRPDAATDGEVRAWYSFDFANSPYPSAVAGGFLPLLLQSTALSAAGFPSVCPNVVTNSTLIGRVFGGEAGRAAAMFYNPGRDMGGGGGCPGAANSTVSCVGAWCAGFPATTSECLDAAGQAIFKMRVSFLGIPIDPTAYAATFVGLSVLAQAGYSHMHFPYGPHSTNACPQCRRSCS